MYQIYKKQDFYGDCLKLISLDQDKVIVISWLTLNFSSYGFPIMEYKVYDNKIYNLDWDNMSDFLFLDKNEAQYELDNLIKNGIDCDKEIEIMDFWKKIESIKFLEYGKFIIENKIAYQINKI